jgi:hypothetical protein
MTVLHLISTVPRSSTTNIASVVTAAFISDILRRSVLILKLKVLGRIAYFPFIHGTHRKRLVRQLFYCCMCIRCRSDVITEPLRNDIKKKKLRCP